MRDEVLTGFAGEVNFSPQEPGPFYTRIEAEQKAGEAPLARQLPRSDRAKYMNSR